MTVVGGRIAQLPLSYVVFFHGFFYKYAKESFFIIKIQPDNIRILPSFFYSHYNKLEIALFKIKNTQQKSNFLLYK